MPFTLSAHFFDDAVYAAAIDMFHISPRRHADAALPLPLP